MTDYNMGQVARLFSLHESRLRYWAQTGLVGPSVRRGGRFYFTFRDLINVRAVVELLKAGLSVQRVREQLVKLRASLDQEDQDIAGLRICSDGDSVVAIADGVAYKPDSGQVVMNFAVASLSSQIAKIHAMAPREQRPKADPPQAQNGGKTIDSMTAYQLFLSAGAAEDRGRTRQAEALYKQALVREPSLAPALTNLGNLYFRRGEMEEARSAYEQALEFEPSQPEARFNLANLWESLGETDTAIAELKRVCQLAPNFADAHYNLGVLLSRVGGHSQARNHLERYLELDPQGLWPHRARELLG